jgi:O-6-methylguanine DNA methyltransferase
MSKGWSFGRPFFIWFKNYFPTTLFKDDISFMKFSSQKMYRVVKSYVSTPISELTLFAEPTTSGVILVSLSFGKKERFNGTLARDSNNPLLKGYAGLLRDFLRGRVRSLKAVQIDLSWCTPFQRAVLDAARSIPWGSVVTYSDLAAMAGHPSAVRASAAVMRNNRFPLVIPCHRVVAKGGAIGGFMGMTSGASVTLKRKLLELEGTALFVRK